MVQGLPFQPQHQAIKSAANTQKRNLVAGAQESAFFGEGGGARVAAVFNVALLGEIPLDPATREGGDAGTPVVESGDGPTRDAFLELARNVAERVQL